MAIRINFPMMQNPPILGADISVYNADRRRTPIVHFDHEQFRAKGGRFLILRGGAATEGLDYEYEHNLAECTWMGTPFWVYHYTKLWKDLDQQVAIIRQIHELAKHSPMYCGIAEMDIEANDGLSKAMFTGNFIKMGIRLEDNIGAGARGTYSRASFWDRFVERNDMSKEMHLHVAHWFPGINPGAVPTARPLLPDDWGAINHPRIPLVWQFDVVENGFEWGSRGEDQIDLDWFTWGGGTEAAWNGMFDVALPGSVQPPPEPEPEPAGGLHFRVLVNTLNVRSGPGKEFPIVSKLARDTIVSAEDVDGANAWIKIAPGKYACVRLGNERYLGLEE